MMAPMPSKSPAKRPAFMLSVTETDSASPAPSSTPTSSSGKFFYFKLKNILRKHANAADLFNSLW